jgi:Arc/MetJ family transcription regulator
MRNLVTTPMEIDQETLAMAAEALGTEPAEDTVNAALREVGLRLVRFALWPGLARWPTAVTSMSSSATRGPTVGDPLASAVR